MRRVLPALALAATIAGLASAPGASAARFDTRLFAIVPTPGFPARAYAAPNGRVYEGTYDNPQGDRVPSRVLEYEGDGSLLRSWTIKEQDLSRAHGVQVATMDGAGRLYLLDKSPARVLTLDRTTGDQKTYAALPAGTVPNYAAWGPDGSLYVTDFEHPVIYRVPAGGGAATPWLSDPKLDGMMFGATGIVLAADRRTLLVGVQSGAGLSAGNPTAGRILKVAIGAEGRPGALSDFWESGSFDAPDGFALAQSGNVYVALLLANQIAVISPQGREITRSAGATGSAVPYDNPSSASFLGSRLVVANQSFVFGDPTHQAILSVDAGEPGLPEQAVPPAPVRPAKPAKKKKKKKA